MAEVFIDRDDLHVALSPTEHVAALHGDLEFPIEHVRSARVSEDPFAPIRGIRSPGTAWPRTIALGTWRSRRHGRTFAAAYRDQPALVIEFDRGYYARVVVSTDQASRLATTLG